MFERIKEDINTCLQRDPAAHSRLEILLTYPGLHAILFHRLSHALHGHKLKLVAKVISLISRWLTGIEIHPNAQIGRRFFIDHGMGIVIGETAVIGEDCTLYHGVTLGGTHFREGKRHPTIESNVIIGAGAKILGPITIRAGARIGSNAVVVKNVSPGATVIGIPGREVENQSQLKSLRREQMAQNLGFDAYAVVDTPDTPDPLSQTIKGLLDHIHQLEQKLDLIQSQLTKAVPSKTAQNDC